jgi:hypothetical protein
LSHAPFEELALQHFVDQANAVHVLNAPSPGATASLAIGEEIVARLGAGCSRWP